LIIDKAAVDLVSLSGHKWQGNNATSGAARAQQCHNCHTIYHAYATVPSLRHSNTQLQIHRYTDT